MASSSTSRTIGTTAESAVGTNLAWSDRILAYLNGTANPRYALQPRIVVVALHNGSPVGFAAGHLTRRFGCEGELQWVNVAAAFRRAGIASELVRIVAMWFIERGARRVCVNVEPDNVAGRGLYARHHAEPLSSHWLSWADMSVALQSPRSKQS
jgi:ribosomal protein S18 acetylase RimI-like enzyme